MEIRKYSCPLCFDDICLEEMVCLDCEHKLCVECFSNYLRSKVVDGEVADNELTCPLPNCPLACEPLSLAMIEAHTTPELWDKFLHFRMKLFRPSSGQFIQCPTTDCAPFIVPRGEKRVECPCCQRAFCPDCMEEPHDNTCEDFRKWKTENCAVDQKFEALIEDEQLMRCPQCGFACERSEGCNFMQCSSAKCRRKTYFCYVCGMELTKELHYRHFPEGPYRLKCETLPSGPRPKSTEQSSSSNNNDPLQFLRNARDQWMQYLPGFPDFAKYDPAR